MTAAYISHVLNSEADTDPFEITHTVSGNNPHLLVLIAWNDSTAHTVDTVASDVDGTFTLIIGQDDFQGQNRIEIWELVAPTSGSHTVTVNMSGDPAEGPCIAVVLSNDINQSTAVRDSAGVAGSGANATLTPSLTGVTGTDLSFVSCYNFEDAGGADAGTAGQTERYDFQRTGTSDRCSQVMGTETGESDPTIVGVTYGACAAVALIEDTSVAGGGRSRMLGGGLMVGGAV